SAMRSSGLGAARAALVFGYSTIVIGAIVGAVAAFSAYDGAQAASPTTMLGEDGRSRSVWCPAVSSVGCRRT
ncbi:MAG: hypothetical protein ACKOYM_10670, partial [Actinomycetes bacterium]